MLQCNLFIVPGVLNFLWFSLIIKDMFVYWLVRFNSPSTRIWLVPRLFLTQPLRSFGEIFKLPTFIRYTQIERRSSLWTIHVIMVIQSNLSRGRKGNVGKSRLNYNALFNYVKPQIHTATHYTIRIPGKLKCQTVFELQLSTPILYAIMESRLIF